MSLLFWKNLRQKSYPHCGKRSKSIKKREHCGGIRCITVHGICAVLSLFSELLR